MQLWLQGEPLQTPTSQVTPLGSQGQASRQMEQRPCLPHAHSPSPGLTPEGEAGRAAGGRKACLGWLPLGDRDTTDQGADCVLA